MSERIFEIKTLKSVIIKNLFEVIKPYIKETNIMAITLPLKDMSLNEKFMAIEMIWDLVYNRKKENFRLNKYFK